MATDRWRMVALLVVAVITLAVGEALIAKGMRQAGRGAGEAGWWAGAKAAITNGWAVAGALSLGLHLVLYATALSKADLSLVMPITAASYPIGTFLARFLLHEGVSPARWFGTLIIAVGVAVVAWGEARPEP